LHKSRVKLITKGDCFCLSN